MSTARKQTQKIGFASLGCPKALVDSERIITQLRAEGYELSHSYDGADLVIVNTCGFIDSAREESLETIGDAMKENGKVIVTGCLGARPEVIREKYPNVLSISGPQQYETVIDAVHEALPPQHDPYVDIIPPGGIKLTPRHYAYLKISEGCNNKCSFCIIPDLRGRLKSRRIDDVMREAERLKKAGVKELLVVSQDTSAYGVDIKYEEATWNGKTYQSRFKDLCEALGELDIWVRLHYVYPYPHVDDVIPLMNEGKVLPYLDIPFQHASPAVLKNMRRPGKIDKTAERILKWREMCPSLTVRSTFIVGFPGETEEDFQMLLDWLSTVELDRVGCFEYEPVAGATANDLGLELVPDDVKKDRWNRFMAHQQAISAKRMQAKIGTEMVVMIDGFTDEGEVIARSPADAPEIDGLVFLNDANASSPDGSGFASTAVDHVPLIDRVEAGDYIRVKITDADEYDLTAEPV